MEINICFCCDNSCVRHMVTAITSIIMNSSLLDNYNFYIIESNLSVRNKSKLNNLGEFLGFSLTYINVSDCEFDSFKNAEDKEHYYDAKTALLPENIDKILYLDSNIVLKDDISKRYNAYGVVVHNTIFPTEFDNKSKSTLNIC